MHVFLWLISMVLFGGTAYGAEQARTPQEPPAIELKATRWQTLPAGVSRVIVDPKGRTWYQHLIRYGTNFTREEVKRHIEREFARPSPQIALALLLLVEPSGRAWFAENGGQTILGYDGKDWIIRTPASRTDDQTGHPPTRGRLYDGNYHRCIDGVVWLLSERGLERFDGNHWQSLEMPPSPDKRTIATKLAVSPDGKLAVALGSTLNVYRAGKWKSVELDLEREKATLHDIAAIDSETLWCQLSTVDVLIAKVSADGTLSSTDPRQELPGTPIRLDQLHWVTGFYRDDTGTIYAVAKAIDGPIGKSPGVLSVQTDGKMHLLLGDAALGWLPHFALYLPPILANSGKEVWIPNRERKRPAALVDLKTQKEIDALPSDRFGILYAVDNEGRVFVSERNLGYSDDPIMVYTPGLPEEPGVTARVLDIADSKFALEDTGAIWARDRSQHVVRIVGEREPVAYPELGNGTHCFLPGREGVMLVCSGSKAALFRRGTLVATGGLLELIEEQLELICRAFSADNPPSPSEREVMLVATPQQQVWCLRGNTLWYYADGAWKDTTAALMRAGSRFGILKYLVAIGDGSQVLVGDLAIQPDGGKCFTATVEDGKFVFEEADYIQQGYKVTYAVRDTSGTLWLRVAAPKRGTPPHPGGAQYAVRLDAKRQRSEVINRGWATLVDHSGNVWLEDAFQKPGSVVNIYREGKIVQELEIPGFGRDGLLFSTRPGKVYAYSSAGLQQLIGEGPTSIPYRLGDRLQIKSVSGTLSERAYAPGNLVISTFVDFPSRHYLLHIIELSKH